MEPLTDSRATRFRSRPPLYPRPGYLALASPPSRYPVLLLTSHLSPVTLILWLRDNLPYRLAAPALRAQPSRLITLVSQSFDYYTSEERGKQPFSGAAVHFSLLLLIFVQTSPRGEIEFLIVPIHFGSKKSVNMWVLLGGINFI